MTEPLYSDEELQEQIQARSDEAKQILNDQDKLEHLLDRLERKLSKVPGIGNKLSNVPVLVSMLSAYARKEYTEIPFASMISITAALLYFVSPIDLIPDVLPGIGYVDDTAVILFATTMIQDDVEEYKAWRERNNKLPLNDD